MFYKRETVSWAISTFSTTCGIKCVATVTPSSVAQIIYEKIEGDYASNTIDTAEYKTRMSHLCSMHSAN